MEDAEGYQHRAAKRLEGAKGELAKQEQQMQELAKATQGRKVEIEKLEKANNKAIKEVAELAINFAQHANGG